jgi:hypothetical protein
MCWQNASAPAKLNDRAAPNIRGAILACRFGLCEYSFRSDSIATVLRGRLTKKLTGLADVLGFPQN